MTRAYVWLASTGTDRPPTSTGAFALKGIDASRILVEPRTVLVGTKEEST
jgi:hypothetical protein